MGNTLTLEVTSDYIGVTPFYEGDSGVDIPCPTTITCKAKEITSVNLKVRCQLVRTNMWGFRYHMSYLLLPRSSISKTPLMMCNSVGLIDAGYTGDLIVKLYNYSDTDYTITEGDRLVQIVSPDLIRPDVVLVDSLRTTHRNARGFGST